MSPISARSRRPAMRRRVDAVEQRARFRRIEHRRLPGRHDVPGPAHRGGRVDRHDLAGDQPVEQVADRGEPLLDARRGELARAGLDPGGDVHRLHGARSTARRRRRTRPGIHPRRGHRPGACAGCGCWPRRIRGSACAARSPAAATAPGRHTAPPLRWPAGSILAAARRSYLDLVPGRADPQQVTLWKIDMAKLAQAIRCVAGRPEPSGNIGGLPGGMERVGIADI